MEPDSFDTASSKKHSNTVHGGSIFLHTFSNNTPNAVPTLGVDTLDAVPELSNLIGAKQGGSWTVHDGNFFASAVNKHQPRELGERRLIREERAEWVTWHKPSTVFFRGETPDRLRRILPGGGETAESRRILQASPAAASDSPHCVPVIAAVPISQLGAGAIDLNAFTLQSSIGMGQFASVHRAWRNSDKLSVGIKRWHKPVALKRQGGASRQDAGEGRSSACNHM